MNQNTARAQAGTRHLRRATTTIKDRRSVAALTAAANSAAVLLPTLLALVFALPGRISAARNERGDAGGKGLIILITTVIGIGVAIAVGVLIKAQIDKRTPGLDQ